jgi:hypothetical protein
MYCSNEIAPPAACMAAVIESAAEGTGDTSNVSEVCCNSWQYTKHQCGYTSYAERKSK